eukprot:3546399-Pleurochrysis_carterae.AAC.1
MPTAYAAAGSLRTWRSISRWKPAALDCDLTEQYRINVSATFRCPAWSAAPIALLAWRRSNGLVKAEGVMVGSAEEAAAADSVCASSL